MESTINWTRRTNEDIYGDGDILLVACDVRGRWVFDIVVIDCDEDDFEIKTQEGESWDGDLDQIVFYTRVSRLFPKGFKPSCDPP